MEEEPEQTRAFPDTSLKLRKGLSSSTHPVHSLCKCENAGQGRSRSSSTKVPHCVLPSHHRASLSPPLSPYAWSAVKMTYFSEYLILGVLGKSFR